MCSAQTFVANINLWYQDVNGYIIQAIKNAMQVMFIISLLFQSSTSGNSPGLLARQQRRPEGGILGRWRDVVRLRSRKRLVGGDGRGRNVARAEELGVYLFQSDLVDPVLGARICLGLAGELKWNAKGGGGSQDVGVGSVVRDTQVEGVHAGDEAGVEGRNKGLGRGEGDGHHHRGGIVGAPRERGRGSGERLGRGGRLQ